MSSFRLVSHALCPYVQRVAISLDERKIAFQRTDIDLANKPDWFLALSPLGKVPLLQVGGRVLFESAVILEYLEDTLPQKLHPSDPVERAEHRGWIEFGSALLNAIAGLYLAADAEAYESKAKDLRSRIERLERTLGGGPWFAGSIFSLVDAVYAPVFRYFDVFAAEGLGDPASELPRIAAWQRNLMPRPSVAKAVAEDYPQRLAAFLRARNSHMSRLLLQKKTA